MREIKFRAWHSGAQEYCEGSVSNMFSWVDDGQPITLEQFIGRKDNNYNDLYEGDIISDHVGIGVIKWSERNNSFKVSYAGKNKGQGKWFADFNLRGELESIQRIGNIHQNPELIE